MVRRIRLATPVLALWIVVRERRTGLRLVFGLIALGLIGWAIYLFQQGDDVKAQRSAECRQKLSSLKALANAKLLTVESKDEAQAIASEMIRVIDASPCEP